MRLRLSTFVLLATFASVALAAEPDPRLAQIEQERKEIQQIMARAQMVLNSIGILEQGQIKLRDLNEEERKIKAETKDKVKDAK